MDSGCTYVRINKKLVKDEKIKIEPINILFKVFNANGTKNGEVMRFALLKVEVNRHKKRINAAVIDLNGMDMFLEYD